MVDNVHLRLMVMPLPDHMEERKPSPYRCGESLIFCPAFNHEGEAKGYTAEYKNLRLAFWGNCLHIRNSLHKFHHGDNYGSFTRSEITASLDELNSLLAYGFTGIDVRQAEVRQFEYGVNFEMENPESYWGQLSNYGGKPFRAMETSSGTAYGAGRKLKQYELKAYSKCFQVKEVDRMNITGRLRLEVVVKEMGHLTARKNNPIPIRIAADLERVEVLAALANDLEAKFMKVVKKVTNPPRCLSRHELLVLAYMTHPDAAKFLAKMTKQQRTRDRRVFKKVLAILPNDFHEIEVAVREKCGILISS